MILLMVLVLLLCPGQAAGANPRQALQEKYFDTRQQVFAQSCASKGIELDSQDQPWAVVIDMGFKKSGLTLVSFMDGEAGLYFSDADPIISKSDITIGEIAGDLVGSSYKSVSLMQKAMDFPLPGMGEACVYVLTGEGVFTSGPVSAEILGAGMDKFSKLYIKGQELIAVLRRLPVVRDLPAG